MASSDWPDYTHGVVLTDGTVTDCPDWQQQVVGPGGVPVGGGGITILSTTNVPSSTSFSGTGTITLASVTLANAAAGWIRAAFYLPVTFSMPAGIGNGIVVTVASTHLAAGPPYVLPGSYVDRPGVAVTIRADQAVWDGPIYLFQANDTVDLSMFYLGISTGASYGSGGLTSAMLLLYTD